MLLLVHTNPTSGNTILLLSLTHFKAFLAYQGPLLSVFLCKYIILYSVLAKTSAPTTFTCDFKNPEDPH